MFPLFLIDVGIELGNGILYVFFMELQSGMGILKKYHSIDDLDRKDQDRDRRSLFDLILDHFLL